MDTHVCTKKKSAWGIIMLMIHKKKIVTLKCSLHYDEYVMISVFYAHTRYFIPQVLLGEYVNGGAVKKTKK